MDVSNRRMQVQLTQEAKIASDFSFYQSDFCGCGLCQRSEPALFARAQTFAKAHTVPGAAPADAVGRSGAWGAWGAAGCGEAGGVWLGLDAAFSGTRRSP